jgi:hypothetical protein
MFRDHMDTEASTEYFSSGKKSAQFFIFLPPGQNRQEGTENVLIS